MWWIPPPENIDAGESEIETSEYDDESREKSIEFSTSIGETESEEERRWSDFCWELLKKMTWLGHTGSVLPWKRRVKAPLYLHGCSRLYRVPAG